jgi:Glycoside hydrolase family 44
VQLDNEPELWNSTHLEVQGPNPVTSDNYIAKTISLTQSLKDQFPDVLIFGPVHYGFEGIYNWQGELSATPTGNNWFPDKYLPAIKTASMTYGKPLVDVYDFHWYSEATDGSGNRITDLTGASLTAAQVQAIVQSPRSLWDTTYTENSWITADVLSGPIYILGRLQSRIASENPGMKLSITEYNNGGGQHIAGTIAQADNLGVFGAQNLFAANLWPLNDTSPYILAGFRAFRDYDNNNSNFGDSALQSTSSNVANVVVYASTDSTTPGRVVFVAINRSTSSQVTAINGQALSGTAHLYQMTATSAQGQNPIQPVSAGTQAVSGSSLTVALPALSVTTIDIF